MTIYFRMSICDADIATDAVWKHQNEAGQKLSRFQKRSIGNGLEYVVWTDDLVGAQALSDALTELHITYSASDQKPDVDRAFGIGSEHELFPICS